MLAVVVEGQGPTSGDMFCRVSRISNDAAHLCKDDPTEFCHVITVRAGPMYGTYLRVDENEADRNTTTVPERQAGFFGGGTSAPTFETSWMREVVMYEYELADDCLEALHTSLMSRYLTSPTLLRASSPPPPLSGTSYVTRKTSPRKACDAHRPVVHSTFPSINENTKGTWKGTNMSDARAALHNGNWTMFMIVAISDDSNLGGEPIIRDGARSGNDRATCNSGSCTWGTDEWNYQTPWGSNFDGPGSWRNMESSIGFGRQMWCGHHPEGEMCLSECRQWVGTR